MQETILITGGSGLVGTCLTALLLKRGYAVQHVSRNGTQRTNVTSFKWDLQKGTWDEGAIKNVNYIIHLAGANVAAGRWTHTRKQQILDSRVKGSKLVAEMVEASGGNIKGVISASAVGYYGTTNNGSLALESDEPGDDFLARVCVQWEQEISQCNTSVAMLRTGVVLSKNGGAVPKMLAPIKLGVGASLGSGTQSMPWIHMNDLCNMYIYIMEKGLSGVFNAVAPELASNQKLTLALAKAVNKNIWMPNVPSIFLKLMLGKMANMLLYGVPVSSAKIKDSGFKFEYPSLSGALSQLLK